MNEMRKLMESIQQINEGWDPEAIAQAIHLEYSGEPKSLFRLKVDQSPEPFRAMFYNFGSMTGLYNPETLDGSEIYHQIVDELERLGVASLDEEDVRSGPQPGEYGDFEAGEDAVYDYGAVRAKLMFSDGEVTLTHGRGEQIFLTMDEWDEFVGELKDT